MCTGTSSVKKYITFLISVWTAFVFVGSRWDWLWPALVHPTTSAETIKSILRIVLPANRCAVPDRGGPRYCQRIVVTGMVTCSYLSVCLFPPAFNPRAQLSPIRTFSG